MAGEMAMFPTNVALHNPQEVMFTAHGDLYQGHPRERPLAMIRRHPHQEEHASLEYGEFLEDEGRIQTDKSSKQSLATPWVTCGGHKAPSCQACTTTDSNGQTVFDHGIEWCHGDCQYAQGACHPKGTITVQGTVQGTARAYHSTTSLPDLLNPNITAYDAATINNAADSAIREENLEAAEKQRKEEEALEAEKFSWSKFWLVVIISFSVILGICAVVSLIALCVFCLMGTPGPAPKDADDEGEGFMDGEENAEEGDAVKGAEAAKGDEGIVDNEDAEAS